ncbi:hypothetical protein G210_5878 [Candida maltosa Xu316]|uniref:Required for respiratory growth protein 9, mitochondrial n=1 Tax=Candida maltosa (strain Xu316) TaxID=1245528 RepID=M3JB45_CANMX|nr:hypothetical protein G210_5878 [Candida maltosa Xu316]
MNYGTSRPRKPKGKPKQPPAQKAPQEILQHMTNRILFPRPSKTNPDGTVVKVSEVSERKPIEKVSFEDFKKSIAENQKKNEIEGQEMSPIWARKKNRLLSRDCYKDNRGWQPKKRLSREEMDRLREIKELFPHFKTIDLSKIFHVSPEAVKRILSSNWTPRD